MRKKFCKIKTLDFFVAVAYNKNMEQRKIKEMSVAEAQAELNALLESSEKGRSFTVDEVKQMIWKTYGIPTRN